MDPTQRRTCLEDHRRSHRLRIQRRKPDDPEKFLRLRPQVGLAVQENRRPATNAKIFDQDGNQKVDANGKPMTRPVKNADSGIFVRGSGKSQVNLWCWPCGSGQLWAFHKSEDPVLRKGALPKVNADKPVGQWNEMKITMKGETVSVVLNGKTVLDKSKMPGVGNKGPIVLQHHGGYNEKTKSGALPRPCSISEPVYQRIINRTYHRLLLTLFL